MASMIIIVIIKQDALQSFAALLDQEGNPSGADYLTILIKSPDYLTILIISPTILLSYLLSPTILLSSHS